MMETHRQKQRKKFRIWDAMLAVAVLVLMLTSIGGSLAYMKAKTGPVTNEFDFSYCFAVIYNINGGDADTEPSRQIGYGKTSFEFTIEHKKYMEDGVTEDVQYQGPTRNGCFFLGWSEQMDVPVIENGWAEYNNTDSFGQLTTITVTTDDKLDEELPDYGFSKTLYAQWGSQLVTGKEFNEAVKKLVNADPSMDFSYPDDKVHRVIFKRVGYDTDAWAAENGLLGDPENPGKGIVVDVEKQGNIKLYYKDDVAYVLSQQHIFANADSSYMFHYLENLQNVEFGAFHTDRVKSMAYMFFQCDFELEQLDLTKFNTSKVEDMAYMFGNCGSLKKIVWDKDRFNTAQVQNMEHMFENCSRLKEIDLTKFNTGNVNSMSHMFSNCSVLPEVDFSSFNTEKVNDMSHMFYNCKSFRRLDLSCFNTSKVVKMENMFHSCGRLVTIYVSNLWNTSQVVESDGMFVGCGLIQGGQGTRFDASKLDKEYARIDGGTASPGYLTDIKAKSNNQGGTE